MKYSPWDSFESDYLHFEEDDHYEGKTKRIIVIAKRSYVVMAEIRWYGPWRQYTFCPREDTVWNKGCLDDIQTVIDSLMKERNDSKVLKK